MRVGGIQDGVIEIITSGEPHYFAPRGFDRLRLIWAFRNFRRLPEPVLSTSERRAIDRLSVTPEVRLTPSTVIIGAVERDSVAYKRPPQSERSVEPVAVMAQQVVRHRAAAAASTSSGDVLAWNPPLVRDSERPGIVPTPADDAPIPTHIASSPADKTPRSNWALALCSTWIPLAAVLVLAVSSFLRIGTASDPIPVNGNAPPAAVPAVDASGSIAPAPREKIAQPIASPANAQVLELKPPHPASALAASRAQALAPATRYEPAKVAVEPTPASPPLSNFAPDSALDSQPGHRPSRMLYPDTPSAARLPRKVLLKATIGPEGNVESVSTISGDPLVAAAAASAMKHWHYASPGAQFETEVMFNFVDRDITTIKFLGDKKAQ
jgi:hypothetical protein